VNRWVLAYDYSTVPSLKFCCRPAGHASGYREALKASRTPNKRTLSSAKGMKLPKIASPTPSHPAGEDTRPGGQLAAKAGPGTHHAAKIRAVPGLRD
jgi:hypothetical protein